MAQKFLAWEPPYALGVAIKKKSSKEMFSRLAAEILEQAFLPSELWCWLQNWLGSHVAVAVAVARSCSSDSICLRCSPKKTEKKESPQWDTTVYPPG